MDNMALTENSDKAYSTSGNQCLDFFTRITRGASFDDYIESFNKVWQEDKESAIKLLMNLRDVRNGKGEKLIPVVLLVYLKKCIPEVAYKALLTKMVHYGYWKDLLKIIEIESRMGPSADKNSIEIEMFVEQLKEDNSIFESQSSQKSAISLCAKWAPSENSHYDHHPIQASKNIRNKMKLSPREYRRMISKLRNHLVILESLMASGRYDQIDFSKLPSTAHSKMKKAFKRNCNSKGDISEERKKLHKSYQEYLKKLSEGKTKVNIKGIQPHQLVDTYLSSISVPVDQLVEGQWTELKKRVMENGSFRSVTAIMDVSGSMSGVPMSVSIALGILVAECTHGPFHGKVITFSEKPVWHILHGKTLKEKVACMSAAHWGSNTNLKAVFDLILDNAKNAKLRQDEMVKTLFIFTDMQFDSCRGSSVEPWETTLENAKRIFSEAGYQLPKIICWNLRTSDKKVLPIGMNENGFCMLSGFSSELLKNVIEDREYTPLSMMRSVLEPYSVPKDVIECPVDSLYLPQSILDNLKNAVINSAIKKAYIKKKTDDDEDEDDD